MPQGILQIKLGSAVGMPTKRLHILLGQAAVDCNRVRNAIVRKWVRWREDNPDWTPGQRRTSIRKGTLKTTKDGKPVMESPMISQQQQNLLYHTYKDVAPSLSSNLANGCLSEVLDKLAGDTPYNHVGAKTCWEATLNYEINPPTFRSLTIPVPKQDSIITFTDDRFTLTFPLLSRQSGYRTIKPSVRLRGYSSGGLSRGNQRLAQRIIAGDVKRSDSQLVFEQGEWEYHLCYHVPITDHGLDPTRVAILTPLREPEGRKIQRPFELRIGDGPVWKLGDGAPYTAEVTRVQIRRKSICNRYKDGHRHGHGRKQFYASLRPSSRAVVDQQDRFIKHLVADIVRFCIMFDAGTVEYREPTMPLRKLIWFEQRGVPFNWTRFAGHLAFKLECNGIAQVTRKSKRKKLPVRIGVPQHKLEYPGAWPQKDTE